jgi:hypothetical protein
MMEEARSVLARLERIEAMERDGSPAEVLLGELRALVVEAEAWARLERASGKETGVAIERLRAAVERRPAP